MFYLSWHVSIIKYVQCIIWISMCSKLVAKKHPTDKSYSPTCCTYDTYVLDIVIGSYNVYIWGMIISCVVKV